MPIGSYSERQANKAQARSKTAPAQQGGIWGVVSVSPITGKAVPGTWRRGDMETENVPLITPNAPRFGGLTGPEPPMYTPEEAAKYGTDVYGRPVISPQEPPMFAPGQAPQGANVYGQRLPIGHSQDPVYDERGNLRAPKNALAQLEDTTPEPFTDPVAKRSYQQEVYNQAQQAGMFAAGGRPMQAYDPNTGMMINRSMYGATGPGTPNPLMQRYFGSTAGEAPMQNEGASAQAAAQNMARQELDQAMGNVSQQQAAMDPNQSMFAQPRPMAGESPFPTEFEALPDELKAEYLQQLQSFRPAM